MKGWCMVRETREGVNDQLMESGERTVKAGMD